MISMLSVVSGDVGQHHASINYDNWVIMEYCGVLANLVHLHKLNYYFVLTIGIIIVL